MVFYTRCQLTEFLEDNISRFEGVFRVWHLSLMIPTSYCDLLWKICVLWFPLGTTFNGWQQSPEIKSNKNNIVQEMFGVTLKCCGGWAGSRFALRETSLSPVEKRRGSFPSCPWRTIPLRWDDKIREKQKWTYITIRNFTNNSEESFWMPFIYNKYSQTKSAFPSRIKRNGWG